jgi:hypothetical protein
LNSYGYFRFCTTTDIELKTEEKPKSEFQKQVRNWKKDTTIVYDQNINEVTEFMKDAVKMLTKKIKIDDLLAIMKLYSVFQFGDKKFYQRIHDVAVYKLQFMKPNEVVSAFLSLSIIYQKDPDLNFSKFFNTSIYKILKSMHSLKAFQVANVVYSMGKTKLVNKQSETLIYPALSTIFPSQLFKR